MAKKHKQKESPAPAAAPAGRSLSGGLRPWLPLLFLLAFGTFMRFSMVLWQPLIFPDSLQYMHLAREIRTGEILEKEYDLDRGFIKSRRIPPFYSLLLAPFAGTDADLEIVGHLISLLLSIYTFIPLYLLTAAIFSRREAFIVGLLFAFHSFVNKFGSPILTESTFTALYVTVIWLAWLGARRASWPLLAAAGAVSALAYMTRDVGVTAFAVAGAAAAARMRLIDRKTWRQIAVPTAALLAAFLIVSAPYFVHIRVRTGRWSLTTQMSTTSITEQLQLYGGDRFDRDRLSVQEKRTRMVTDQPASGPLGLVRVAPALALKVVRNAYGYFRELLTKAQSFPVFLFFVGLLAVGVDFHRGRDRTRLFDQLWPAVWVLQLLTLYALVTPYMVDIRYMYPLLPPLFALAGRGLTFTADEAEQALAGRRPGHMWPYLLAAAAVVVYIADFAPLTDNEAYARTRMIFGSLGLLAKLFPALALSALFGVVLLMLWPGPLRAVAGWTRSSQTAIGAALLAAGVMVMLVLAQNSPGRQGILSSGPLGRVGLAALLAGPGVALLLSGLSRRPPRPLLLPAVLTGALLLFCAPDTIYQWKWYSSDELTGKYSSGYREAAAEIKALKLVPPGSIICARKPFIAYYLDGSWYLDEEQQPIPKRDSRLLELLQEHKIDFLALDTFTMKNLRPALTERALALEPLPGAALIYGRYFPEYNRVITIYDCRRNDPGVPKRATAAEYFQAAVADYQRDQLPFALREVQAGLALDPENANAWQLTVQILGLYYNCVSRSDVPSIALAPRVLPAMVKASERYLSLQPADPAAQSRYQQAKGVLAQENAEVKKMLPGIPGADSN